MFSQAVIKKRKVEIFQNEIKFLSLDVISLFRISYAEFLTEYEKFLFTYQYMLGSKYTNMCAYECTMSS